MARRTINDEIAKLEAERDKIEHEMEQVFPYQKLRAMGMFGSETTFVDYEALTVRLDRVKEKLTTLYNARGY